MIFFRGKDAPRFVHNLCTQHVLNLPSRACVETFLTTVQGKTLSHGILVRLDDGLLYCSTAGQAEVLLKHFEKYHINEDVHFEDVSSQWGELLIWGGPAGNVLADVAGAPTEERNGVAPSTPLPGCWIAPSPMLASPCWSVLGPRETLVRALHAFTQAGVEKASSSVWQTLRIEHGYPLFGVDFTARNLPQELDRDALSIHFQKGCYLGQETIARIDALGHVNQYLRALAFTGNPADFAWPSERPSEVSGELSPDATRFAQVLSLAGSLCWSPQWNNVLALCMVRRGEEKAGTVLGETAAGWRVMPTQAQVFG